MARIAYKTGGLLLCLMAAVSLWPGSALALDPGAPVVAGLCDGGRAPDCRMLFAIGAGMPREIAKDMPVLAFAGERLPAVPDGAGKQRALGVQRIAAQGGGKDTAVEHWARSADGAPAEPGFWVLLVAGFLGICAVARPRIFTS